MTDAVLSRLNLSPKNSGVMIGVQARGAHGAGQAQGLGVLDVSGQFGEPQLRVVRPARQFVLESLGFDER